MRVMPTSEDQSHAICPVCKFRYMRTISPLPGCSRACKEAYSRIPKNRRLNRSGKTPRSIRPESLTMKHLGRDFPALGRLLEFRCTTDGWVLIGTDATRTYPADASISYSDGHHHG